ncbi:hypothetical protein U2F26_05640 [Micromonospora sp. 4G57]|uniref:Uncharacterized protein n=1 Tax=Micromonospora sicca TaxID=2202420 RepID=A0ABU5J8Z7_9ACTN|nr:MULTISPECIES: hypothetical protein [unclassified Micromonospora]MDZ5442218.1 hypothetical protein [Micromonospora sp. 4G57]MDZ5489023.1 hypothetical protein [Micromonospora sp. 4G53]
MPMLAPATPMVTSHMPSSAALPAKQYPAAIPIRSERSRASDAKVVSSRPATVGCSVSLGRPPPPSAKTTTGSPSRAATSRSRSVLR